MTKVTVTFLLDETGSMMSIKDDTIGGFNQYLSTLKAMGGEVSFSLLKFDSNRVEKVCVGKPVAEVAELTNETYTPGALTPLYDAAVKAIKATEPNAAGAKVIVVIQTDGHENASREYKRADLADLIKEKTAAGWEFVFLGAGIDAYGEAQALGINAANTVSYCRANSGQTFSTLARNSVAYATGMAESMSFSPKQKLDAGDVYQPAATATAVAVAPPTQKPKRRAIVDDISLAS